MDEKSQSLTIGTLATLAGVHVETIRFYQRKGLLPEPDKPYGSIRRYATSEVARVQFVKSAQRLGFSLDEISRLLSLDDGTHCDEARAGRCPGEQAEMGEDLGDHGRIVDGGDDRQGTAATRGHCATLISNTGLRKPSLAFAGRHSPFKTAPGGFVSNWAKLRRTGAEGWGASA